MTSGVLLLTGNLGCGKTTLASKIKDYLEKEKGFTFDGYRTFFSEENDGIRDLWCQPVKLRNGSFQIAQQNLKPYRRIIPCMDAFNRMAQILERIDPKEGVFIDEIGFLETLHDGLQQAIFRILIRRKNVIAVVRSGGSLFLQKLRTLDSVLLVEVTELNRDKLLAALLNR